MNYTEINVGDGQRTLLDIKSKPVLIRRGTLTKEVKVREGLGYKQESVPIYVVELAEEPDGTNIVSVFKAVSVNGVIQKAYTERYEKPRLKDTTPLGKLAKQLYEKKLKSKRIITTNHPLFLTPVVRGVDTFTLEEGMGFYEREPDKLVYTEGKPGIQYGENTGVFIGLNSIKWEKAYVSVGQLVQNYVADKQIWFDLGGSKPQFKSEMNQ